MELILLVRRLKSGQRMNEHRPAPVVCLYTNYLSSASLPQLTPAHNCVVALVTFVCSWFLIGVDRGRISKCCYYGEQEAEFIF
jgi:hypothetical protein